MTHRVVSKLLMLAAAGSIPALAAAQVDFSQIDEAENIDIEAIVNSGNYFATNGIARGPNDSVIAVHWTDDFRDTFVRIDDHAGNGEVIKTDTQIVTELGAPYGPSLVLDGGMDSDLNAGKLYFIDTFSGEFALISMDLASPYAVTAVLRSEDLDDASDLAVLPDGQVVLVRGSAGIGLVNPSAATPQWTQAVTMADLQAVLGTTDPAPPEAVGVDLSTGDVYVFSHGVDALFRIENITSSPAITHLDHVVDFDFHGMVVDQNGVIYGFHEDHDSKLLEGGDSIVIIDGEDIFEFFLDDIAELVEEHLHEKSTTRQEEHDHHLDITLWRGLAVIAEEDEVKLYLASANDEFGVVILEFTLGGVTSVDNWEVYH